MRTWEKMKKAVPHPGRLSRTYTGEAAEAVKGGTIMGKQLKPEAQIRLEHYNEALLRKDNSVEHELATYMDAFLQGYNGEPHPPFRLIGGEDLTDILEDNDAYDTLEDALYDYCRAHEEMDTGDYAKLTKAADSVAYYEYQNYKEPEELVVSYIQHQKVATK